MHILVLSYDRCALWHEIHSIILNGGIVTEYRHNGTNVVTLPSGNTSNVGKLCMSQREADEA